MITVVLFRDHGNQPQAAIVTHNEGFSAHNPEDRDQVTNALGNFDYNRGFIFVGPLEEVPSEILGDRAGTELTPQELTVQ